MTLGPSTATRLRRYRNARLFHPIVRNGPQRFQGWNDYDQHSPKVAATATLGWRMQPRCGCRDK